MQLISVQVGLPRLVEYNGQTVETAIFKTPVDGRVEVGETNIVGDKQADLRYHGGWSKAVYAYPFEHYEAWRAELPGVELPPGVWGENLTVAGLHEADVNIGDRLRVGTAEFIVTEPREPCSKLNVRFGRSDIVRLFEKSHRSGVYLAIAKTGEVGAGDAVEIIHRDPNRVSILDLTSLRGQTERDLNLIERALQIEALPVGWRKKLKTYRTKQV